MRLPQVAVVALGMLVPGGIVFAADSAADVIKQKEQADTTWRTIQTGPTAKTESAHFLVYGMATEPRLKALASNLERQYSTAFKGLQFDKDAKPWPGKLAVYVFADRGQFRTFVRQIEKRSPDEADQSSARMSGDTPHIAVAPGQGKDAVSAETQAGYEVTGAMISIRAKGTQLPEWLTQGFARATAAQAANMPAGARKRVARQLAGRSKPADAWNEAISIEQRLPLAASVADYLFYGKGLSRPGDFLLAFRPDDEKPMKTVVDAFEAAKLTPEKFEAQYLAWLRSNN